MINFIFIKNYIIYKYIIKTSKINLIYIKMEIEENIPEYTMKLHKAKTGYVAELFVKEREDQSKSNDIELIMIVDRSGSMGQYYTKIFKKVMPLLLEKIHYPENKKVHFITFDSTIEHRKRKRRRNKANN